MKKYKIEDIYLCQIDYVTDVTLPKNLWDSYNYNVRFTKFAFCIKKGNNKYLQISSGKEFLTNQGKYEFYIGEYMITKVHPLDNFLKNGNKKISYQSIVKLEGKYNKYITDKMQQEKTQQQSL